MANLTNSVKLIAEMNKKANRSEIPAVYDSTVTFKINNGTGKTMSTNQPAPSTVNLEIDKSTVGLGNVDNTSDANKPVSTAQQAALDLKADKSTTYTKTEVDSAISSAVSSAYTYKGSVADYDSLPASGNTAGDVRNVEDTGMNYAWTGSAWDALGTTVDLSAYQEKLTEGEGINIDANNEISLNAEFMTQSAYDNITPESGKYYLIYEHRYPDISISVSSNYEGQTPGYHDEVQFIVRVTNDGDSAITINTESQLTQDYYSNTFNPGQTREYELSWLVEDTDIKTGSFVFDITASEENNPENTITYTKTIMTEPIQYPTLSIQITPSQQSAQLGDNVDFDISITNNLYYINEVTVTSSSYSEWYPEIRDGKTVDLQDNRTVDEADVTQGSFTFTVTAQESGNSQNTATASVTIPVTS